MIFELESALCKIQTESRLYEQGNVQIIDKICLYWTLLEDNNLDVYVSG